MLYVGNIEYTDKAKRELLKLEVAGLIKIKDDFILSMAEDIKEVEKKINSICEADGKAPFYGFNNLDGEYLKDEYGYYMLQEKEYKFCDIEITGYDLIIELSGEDITRIYNNRDFEKSIKNILSDRLRKRLYWQLNSMINDIDEWELKSM